MQLDKQLQEPHKPYRTELEHLGFISCGTVVIEPGEAAVRALLEELAQETPPPKQIALPDPNGPGTLRDIFALIGKAWHREPPITRNGPLFKKAEEELYRCMEGCTNVKGDGPKRLVLSFALNRGLLAEATYDERGKTGFVATEYAWHWPEMTWGQIWADMTDSSVVKPFRKARLDPRADRCPDHLALPRLVTPPAPCGGVSLPDQC